MLLNRHKDKRKQKTTAEDVSPTEKKNDTKKAPAKKTQAKKDDSKE